MTVRIGKGAHGGASPCKGLQAPCLPLPPCNPTCSIANSISGRSRAHLYLMMPVVAVSARTPLRVGVSSRWLTGRTQKASIWLSLAMQGSASARSCGDEPEVHQTMRTQIRKQGRRYHGIAATDTDLPLMGPMRLSRTRQRSALHHWEDPSLLTNPKRRSRPRCGCGR